MVSLDISIFPQLLQTTLNTLSFIQVVRPVLESTAFYFVVSCFFQCPNTYCFQHANGQTTGPRVRRFGLRAYLDNIWVDLEVQGHRSKVEVKTLGQKHVLANRYSLHVYNQAALAPMINLLAYFHVHRIFYIGLALH